MQVRVLKKLDCDEISPVLRGAGVGTGTLSIKAVALKENHFAGLIEALGELATVTAADASVLSATGRKQLEDIQAALGKALAPASSKLTAGSMKRSTGALRAQSQSHLPAGIELGTEAARARVSALAAVPPENPPASLLSPS
jgi:hypothetical protein